MLTRATRLRARENDGASARFVDYGPEKRNEVVSPKQRSAKTDDLSLQVALVTGAGCRQYQLRCT
jgi:hypothetical protein